MKIVLAGASGFVGARMTPTLLKQNHDLLLIAHNPESQLRLQRSYPAARVVIADLADSGAVAGIRGAMEKSDAIIYLPGLLREFPSQGITFQKIHVEGVRNLLAAAKELGIRRWLQMSALGTSPNATTGYFKTKWAGEELVRSSGLEWTIFRPSVIFSDQPTKQLNFVGELANVIRSAPVLPVFGDGMYRMQPIALQVVAESFARALALPETIGKTFDLGGPEVFTYTDIMRNIAQAMGKSKPVVHIPFWSIEMFAALFDQFKLFPVSRDQLTMLKLENIVRDPEKAREFETTFQPEHPKFAEALRSYFSK